MLASKKQYQRIESIPSTWRNTVIIVAILALLAGITTYYVFEFEQTTKILWASIGTIALGVGIYFYILQTR
jgi:hypothetical protein